jgi:hypothetical protein
VLKYDAGGNLLWSASPSRKPGSYGLALALDSAGNVCVTGEEREDFLTAKYSPAGDLLWAARYDGPGFGADRARAIAMDGAGNVVVTGPSHDERSSLDYATVKYNRDGKQLWVARYDDPIQEDDLSSDVSIDMRSRGNAM